MRRLPCADPGRGLRESRRWILGGVLAIVAIALPTVLLLAKRPRRCRRARSRRRASCAASRSAERRRKPGPAGAQGSRPLTHLLSERRKEAMPFDVFLRGVEPAPRRERLHRRLSSGRASRARSAAGPRGWAGVLPFVPRRREPGSRVPRNGGAQARDEVQLEERGLRGLRLFAKPRSESEGDSMTVKPMTKARARLSLLILLACLPLAFLRLGSVEQRRPGRACGAESRTKADVDSILTTLKPTERLVANADSRLLWQAAQGTWNARSRSTSSRPRRPRARASGCETARLVEWVGDGLPHRTRVFVEVRPDAANAANMRLRVTALMIESEPNFEESAGGRPASNTTGSSSGRTSGSRRWWPSRSCAATSRCVKESRCRSRRR